MYAQKQNYYVHKHSCKTYMNCDPTDTGEVVLFDMFF